MKSMKKNLLAVTLVTLVAVGMSSLAAGQALNSGAQAININATLAESLTLSLSANSVSIPLTAGAASNPGAATITATTKWVLKPGRTAVGVYAYFGSAAAALTDGAGDNIPSSAFSIADNGGAAATLVNTVPFGAALAGLQLENIAITGTNKNSTVADTMAFNINLSSGTLPQLPAATYTGVLNIQAQATP